MQATLLVLAGGASRRMGRPKAWLEVGEITLLRWMIERLGPAFSEVVVSFAEPEQVERLVPFRLVFDRKLAAGPLAGLEAGLTAARHDVTWLEGLDPELFRSLNTPEDFERFHDAFPARR